MMMLQYYLIFVSIFLCFTIIISTDSLRRRNRLINEFVQHSSKSNTSSSSFPPVFFPINNKNNKSPSFVNQSRIEKWKIFMVKTNSNTNNHHPISVILPSQKHHGNNNNNNKLLLQKVSKQIQQSKNYNYCKEIATNGGPFNSDGTCVGPVICHGKLINNSATTTWPGFGRGININNNNNSSFYVLGEYFDIMRKIGRHDFKLTDFVTGLFGWLIYDNQIVVDDDHNYDVMIQQQHEQKQAPRTVIGIDNHNHWFILVADGCEKCPPPYHHGMTLKELAKVLREEDVVDAKYAINLDGGGSTTMVDIRQHKLINHPTCLDVLPIKCERPVATIICIG